MTRLDRLNQRFEEELRFFGVLSHKIGHLARVVLETVEFKSRDVDDLAEGRQSDFRESGFFNPGCRLCNH